MPILLILATLSAPSSAIISGLLIISSLPQKDTKAFLAVGEIAALREFAGGRFVFAEDIGSAKVPRKMINVNRY